MARLKRAPQEASKKVSRGRSRKGAGTRADWVSAYLKGRAQPQKKAREIQADFGEIPGRTRIEREKARAKPGELWLATSGNRSPLGRADPRGFRVYTGSQAGAHKELIPGRMMIGN